MEGDQRDRNDRPEVRISGSDLSAKIAEEVNRAMLSSLPSLISEVRRVLEQSGKETDEHREKEKNDRPADREAGEGSSGNKSISYKQFKACGPPSFEGKKDVVATFKWLREMEAKIKLSKCAEEQKVEFAVNSFEAEALFWWDTVIHSMGDNVIDRMSWDEFKKLVIKKILSKR